jgi:hypothetical protein
MFASTGLGHPVRACAGWPGWLVPFSTPAPSNYDSEVLESAGLRPANCGEETLPTIGKVCEDFCSVLHRVGLTPAKV